MADNNPSTNSDEREPVTDAAEQPGVREPFWKNIWFERIALCLLIFALIGGWHVYRRGWWFLLPSLPSTEVAWEDDTPARRLAEALNIPAPPDMSKLDEHGAKNLRVALTNLRKLPKDGYQYGVLGRVYEAQGASEGALKLYERAIELDPKNHAWHYHAGWLALRQGSAAQARASLKRTIDLNPDYAPAYMHLGDLALQAGDLDQARQMFDRYLQLRPGDVAGQLALARLAMAREDWQAVLDHVNAAQAAGNTGRMGHQLLAVAYSRLENNEQARNEMRLAQEDASAIEMEDPLRKRVLELQTSLTSIIEQFAMYYGQGRFHEALGYAIRWKDATVGRPEHAEAWARVADCHRQLGEFEAASIAIAEAMKEAPTSPEVHCVFGQIRLAAHDLLTAMRAAERSLTLKEDYLPGRLLRGQVMLELAVQDPKKLREAGIGRTPMEIVDRAAEDLQAVAGADPEFARPQVQYLLGMAMGMRGEYTDAASHFRESLKFTPDSPGLKRLLEGAEGEKQEVFWPYGVPTIVMASETQPATSSATP